MRLYLVSFVLLLFCSQAWADDVVSNGSFEMPPESLERPRYWYVGWSDSPAAYAGNGSWTLDPQYQTDGLYSLKLSPNNNADYSFSQILHVPTYDLTGKTVSISVDVRKNGLSEVPSIFALALNPELPDDPVYGIGLAGKVVILADGPDGEWQTYTGNFTATDNAVCLAIALITDGTTGSAWFDNVIVDVDVPVPGPTPALRDPVLSTRQFRLGFVGDNPSDYSEKGEEEMIQKAASAAEAFNIFFHVRWTSLTGETVTDGHKERLQQARRARAAGLSPILTFDFTHDDADSVGDINMAPDGNPPPGANPFDLTNPVVRNAYKEELLAVAAIVQPQWVLVGIELDIFHGKHPGQWDEYVTMYKDVYNALKAQHPSIKVGAYFCLAWMVSNDGIVNMANAADWQQLLPELDFVGYSAYPGTTFYPAGQLANGYFTAAHEVAPNLPLFLPEFGITGGNGATLTEGEQAAFLERILQELSQVNVEVACWYSLYDQSYIGAPVWFQTEFGRLGMHRQDGTDKEVWTAWQAAYSTSNPFTVIPKKKKSGCNLVSDRFSTTDSAGIVLPLILLLAFLLLRVKGSSFNQTFLKPR